jgi:predicted O-methyltransferase YrrM
LIQAWYRFYKFFTHYIIAKNEHGIHSPFVFSLYTDIIQAINLPFYLEIETYYHKLLSDSTLIENENPGVGTKKRILPTRQLIGSSVKLLPWRKLICRITKERNPKVIIELGTSAGITAAYLALTCKDAHIYTFEANPALIEISKKLFNDYNLKNITLIEGDIDETLEPFLKSIDRVDVAYIDANHRYQSTLNYYNQLHAKCTLESLIILDDIYWSKEMTKAWNEIRQASNVSIDVDLWQIGLLYYKPNQHKESFKLKF